MFVTEIRVKGSINYFACLFYSGMNCFQTSAQVKQSCGLVNETVCGGLGCCWNGSEANSTLRCFNKRYNVLQIATVDWLMQNVLHLLLNNIKTCGV